MSLDALMNQANKLIEVNQSVEAKQLIADTKGIEIKSPQQLREFAHTLCNLGYISGVTDIIKHYFSKENIDTRYYLILVELYMRDGNLKFAENMLKKLSDTDKKLFPIIHAYIGIILSDNFQFEASNNFFDKALEAEASFTWIYYRKAYNLMMLGKMKEGWETIETGKALDTHPEHPIYLFNQHNAVIEACYDEFMSNPYSFEATMAALELERPTSELIKTGEKEPDSIFWALQFMIFIRKQGIMKNMNDRTMKKEEGKIAKNIFFYCENPEEYQQYSANIETWKEKHPDYKIILIHDQIAIDYIEKQFKKELLTAYLLSSGAAKMNLFALACLYMHGGIFVHAKTSCVKSLDLLVQTNKDLILFQDNLGFISNELIMAEPRHKVIGNMLVHATDNALKSLKDDDTTAVFETGNGHITIGTLRSLLPKLSAMKQDFADWAVLDTQSAQQYIWLQA